MGLEVGSQTQRHHWRTDNSHQDSGTPASPCGERGPGTEQKWLPEGGRRKKHPREPSTQSTQDPDRKTDPTPHRRPTRGPGGGRAPSVPVNDLRTPVRGSLEGRSQSGSRMDGRRVSTHLLPSPRHLARPPGMLFPVLEGRGSGTGAQEALSHMQGRHSTASEARLSGVLGFVLRLTSAPPAHPKTEVGWGRRQGGQPAERGC